MELNYVEIGGKENRALFDDLCWALFDLEYEHCIFISNPNEIFTNKVVTKCKKDITECKWSNVKNYSEIQHFFKDYPRNPNVYIVFAGHRCFGYNYLAGFINQIEELKKIKPCHLALTNIYYNYHEVQEVRAIFRATKEGMQVAINPEFIKKYAKEYPVLEQFAVKNTETLGV